MNHELVTPVIGVTIVKKVRKPIVIEHFLIFFRTISESLGSRLVVDQTHILHIKSLRHQVMEVSVESWDPETPWCYPLVN